MTCESELLNLILPSIVLKDEEGNLFPSNRNLENYFENRSQCFDEVK